MTAQQTIQIPRRPALDRDVAMRLAAAEYDLVVAQWEGLTPDQWAAPTICPPWDVRAMAGHLLGMAQMAATLPEMARQQLASQRRAKREGGPVIDAMTALQVEKNAGATTRELVEAMRRTGPKAARARRRTPSFVRSRNLPDRQLVSGQEEVWTLGYLLDIILTRDPFMHRIDIAQASGATMHASAEHEGMIVDDVVREWANRHGQPYGLDLTGPAGGRWGGDDGEQIQMDAFEFCRAVSGRRPESGLLTWQVPF